MSYPNLLIISNDCLSNSSSNGRTLRNFIIGWPKEKIAQFCLHSNSPDYEVCDRYFFVSDQDALQSWRKKEPAIGVPSGGKVAPSKQPPQKTRNALTMMARNFIWNSMRWAGDSFYQWVESFSPEVILLQAGDCAFMLKLATKLSNKYRIPLVIYNSEAYYFKKFDYFRSKGIAKLFYPLFRLQFCSQFKKTLKQAKVSIYCCDKLKKDYDIAFGLPSVVIYTATQMGPANSHATNSPPRISYLGNLGVGRHEGLVEIANALQNISPDLHLDVYGKIPNETVESAFESCAGIRYNGFVSYEEVVEIMQQSDLLVHTESFSDFYKEDLKYAFSTKIADSLASGTCFLLYAPKEMACTEYLMENRAAYVVDQKGELLSALQDLLADSSKLNQLIPRALEVVSESHDAIQNAKDFQTALLEAHHCEA